MQENATQNWFLTDVKAKKVQPHAEMLQTNLKSFFHNFRSPNIWNLSSRV